jgi:hypothetical protein
VRAAIRAASSRAATLRAVSAARAAALEMMPGYAVPSGSVDLGRLLATLRATLPEPLATQVRTRRVFQSAAETCGFSSLNRTDVFAV